MDAFWGITIIVLIVVAFTKRENRIRDEKREIREANEKKLEEAKQAEVVTKYTTLFGEPETQEEKEAARAARQAEAQREKDIAELKKQGFTDELIATIIPTINNGQ